MKRADSADLLLLNVNRTDDKNCLKLQRLVEQRLARKYGRILVGLHLLLLIH